MKKFISHRLTCSQHGSYVYFIWSIFQSLRVLNILEAHCKFKQVIINRTNQDGIKEKVFVNENIVVGTCTIVESEDIDIEIEVECRLAFPSYRNASGDVKSATNSLNGREFVKTIYRFYVEIVHWRRNLFKLSSGNAAKMFKQELTKWLEHFNCDSEHNSITLKVYMVLP